MPLATVVIPCGPRHVHLLDRAVDSVLSQTYPTDVLTMIDTKGRGPAFVRNRLAERVKTPFIAFLDADDWLEPTFIEKTFKTWRPGTYVYTDWYEGGQHVAAHNCYPYRPNPGERYFHLPPVLMPTKMYHELGGMDESLFAAEDTDFFLKANANMIPRLIVREPLLTYTNEGYRSKEGFRDPHWQELLGSIWGRYKERVAMGCCGKPGKIEIYSNDPTPESIVVRPTNNASVLYRGRVTGKRYGRISKHKLVHIDPRDFVARDFERVKDWVDLSPTPAEISHAATVPPSVEYDGDPVNNGRTVPRLTWPYTVSDLTKSIKTAGVRTWGPNGEEYPDGYDIQQDPAEAAELLHLIASKFDGGPVTVLEIGTGKSAGLARYMVDVLGWTVTSVDVAEPIKKPKRSSLWTLVLSSSQDYEADRQYHAVLIDGGHTEEEARADWDRFGDLAPIVALHDISVNAIAGPGPRAVWEQLAYTKTGKLRVRFSEFVSDGAGLGWGVRVTNG